MRIIIVAPGSRGDVQPYIALGKSLKNTGRVVRFVTHLHFLTLITSHGQEFWSVDSDVQGIVENKDVREWWKSFDDLNNTKYCNCEVID